MGWKKTEAHQTKRTLLNLKSLKNHRKELKTMKNGKREHFPTLT
jgi:hypothetical protein